MDYRDALVAEQIHLRKLAYRLTRNRHATEDLVQDTLVKALQRGDQLDSNENIRPWLFRILLNTYRDQYRRHRRGEAVTFMLAEANSVRSCQDQQVFLGEVLSAIDRLAAHHLRLILAGCAAQLSYREMAQRLGLPIGTVRSRVSRARALLTRQIGESGRGEPLALPSPDSTMTLPARRVAPATATAR